MSELNWAGAGAGAAGTPGMAVAGPESPAPIASDAEYPIRAGLNAPLAVARWRVLGNYILAIPHIVVLYVLNIVAQIFVLVAWFAVLFTARLPEGMGGFIAGVHRYQWRVMTYVLFLREQYPKFGVPGGYEDPGDDPAWLQITPAERYSRLAVLFRGLLAIPQALFGMVLYIAFFFAWIAAFFAVLVTGRWPEGLRRFTVGIGFWMVRLNAWYALLADRYPPFSIS